MKPTVSLKDVVDAIDIVSDEMTSFLNTKTGELVTLTDEIMSMAEDEDDNIDDFPQWEQEMVIKAKAVQDTDDYLQLPDKYDINEYGIMEDFCYSVEHDKIKRDLLNAIDGRGAFRRFKDTIRFHGIEKDWYRFRDERLEEIAVDWLEANEIPFTRDDHSEPGPPRVNPLPTQNH